MTYYKATRLDGTSFYDETTEWKVGRITRLAEPKGTTLCDKGMLHASTEKAETLVGGSWPCRLFEVEPRSKVITGSRHKYKVGAYAWKVVRELPAHEALGPNGEEVVALIERCETLIPGEVKGLAAACDAAWDAAWYAAWYATWDAARSAARSAAMFEAWYATWDAARSAAWSAAWYAAVSAARDAALAIVVKDLIRPEHFDLLYGPWASVMEEEK